MAEVPRPLSAFFHPNYGDNREPEAGADRSPATFHTGKEANAPPTPGKDILGKLRVTNDEAGDRIHGGTAGSTWKADPTLSSRGYVIASRQTFEAPIVSSASSSSRLDSLFATCTSRPGDGMQSGFWSTDSFDASSSNSRQPTKCDHPTRKYDMGSRPLTHQCDETLLFGAISHHPVRRHSSSHKNLRFQLQLPRLAHYESGPDALRRVERQGPLAGSDVELLHRVLAADVTRALDLGSTKDAGEEESIIGEKFKPIRDSNSQSILLSDVEPEATAYPHHSNNQGTESNQLSKI